MSATAYPEMIRLARVSRGLSQSDVAARLGIQQPGYAKIEHGEVGVSDEHLSRLAEALGYPISFFEQTDRVWGTGSPHHRKRRAFGPREMGKLEAELNVYRLNLRRLMVGVEITNPFELPALDLDDTGLGTPVEAARHVRRLLRIPAGPIANVTQVLEDVGCIIIEKWYPHDRFDAISVWAPSEPGVVLMNASYQADRKRYTLAHELAHLVLHASNVPAQPEVEANEFTAEFLMPAQEIRGELRSLRLQDLPNLKRRWKVSMRALVYRAQTLNAITRDQLRYMMIRLNQEYGAKREPVTIAKEEPKLLPQILHYLREDLGYSIDEIAAMARRTTEDFIESFGVGPRLHVV